MLNKVLITHAAALKTKYAAAYEQLESAIAQLVQADRARGLQCRLVRIDSADDMQAVGGRTVHKPSPDAAKRAVDAICEAWHPEYVVLLGGPEIIPFVPLNNPCYAPHGDHDRVVPSDLPYACSARYSTDPAKFLGPTRIVGRLPDVPGVADPTFLLDLLRTASDWQPRDAAEYRRYFAISAQAWQGSTTQSLATVFGSSDDLAIVPPAGPSWPDPHLGRRIHFINCHGKQTDPTFYGQHEKTFPVAETSTQIIDKVTAGTVVAAECCYGAELFPPHPQSGQLGICLTYMGHGAYAFLGSSTIAYGPSEGNGQADLICQYFLEAVLSGASTGRALLEARHRFAASFSHLDPADLKTLAQFYLLGDPAIQAVVKKPHALSNTDVYHKAIGGGGGARALRRERMVRTGINLRDTLGAVCELQAELPESVREILEEAARKSGLEALTPKSFAVKFPAAANRGELRQFSERRDSRSIHMVSGRLSTGSSQPPPLVTLIATVEAGQIVHLRRVHSHGAPIDRELPADTPQRA